MSVLGIGVDLVEVDRIARIVEKDGSAFLEKVFTAIEREYCDRMRRSAPYYAARWAAKEAVAKAFGTGFGAQIGWGDIEVRRKASGEPFIQLHGAGAELARRRGVREILISLSHTDHQAVAFVQLLG